MEVFRPWLVKFGISQLRPPQIPVVRSIYGSLTDEEACPNTLLTMGTGGGKTLCFTLPSLTASKRSLIVYPLLSLMEDQGRRFDELGIAWTQLKGGMEPGERKKTIEAIGQGRYSLILSNPEMLAALGEDCLATWGIQHLIVDEAHTFTQWGKSFRSGYRRLAEIRRWLGTPATTACTATGSGPIVEDIKAQLFLGEPVQHLSQTIDRPNIHYRQVLSLSPSHSLAQLIGRPGIAPHWSQGYKRMVGQAQLPALLFLNSRSGVERWAMKIRHQWKKADCWAFHAGLSDRAKKARAQAFRQSKEGILVATCAYGMGIDNPNIKTVVHMEPPSDIESYVQEVGRGGRDGGEASGYLLLTPRVWSRRERYGSMAGLMAPGGCLVAKILGHFGEEFEGPCRRCGDCQPLVHSESQWPWAATWGRWLDTLDEGERLEIESHRPRGLGLLGPRFFWGTRGKKLAPHFKLRRGIATLFP